MEKIQRQATRLICGPDQPYMERLKKLKWQSLELRRKYLCLVQLYKIMFDLCDIDKFKYLDIVGESRTRSRHRYKLRPKHAITLSSRFSIAIYQTGILYHRMLWKPPHCPALSKN
jgi:hypothetical protein